MNPSNHIYEPFLGVLASIPMTLAASINDNWLIGIVGACFTGGSAFCVWAWRQIKTLSLTVHKLETAAANHRPVAGLSNMLAQLAQSCPFRAHNQCPLGETVDITVGQLQELLTSAIKHERSV